MGNNGKARPVFVSERKAPYWETKHNRGATNAANHGEVLHYAKQRFMEGANWETLFLECGLPGAEYTKHAPGWIKERTEVNERILEEARRAKIGEVCEDLARDSLEIVSRTLKALNESKATLEPKDLKIVFEIATGMWKISQIEKGGVINRVEYISPEEALNVLRGRAKDFASKHGSIIDMECEEQDLQLSLPTPELEDAPQ